MFLRPAEKSEIWQRFLRSNLEVPEVREIPGNLGGQQKFLDLPDKQNLFSEIIIWLPERMESHHNNNNNTTKKNIELC